MSRRLTHEYIDLQFTLAGYQLLTKYEKSDQKLEFICPFGHKHNITWDGFKAGRRCSYCQGRIVTHEQVEKAFSDEGFKLLSKYKNSGEMLDFICPRGHHHSIIWESFKSGVRCAYCSGRRATHEMVEKAFSEEGYQLLDRYKTSATKMNFICPKGHSHSMSYTKFKQGVRCAYCSGNIVTQEQVEKAFFEKGYVLLSKYSHHKSSLNFVCSKGHKSSMSWDTFNSGRECPQCFPKRVVTQEEVEKAFNDKGYRLLGKYEKNSKKIDFICSKGHKHSISWSHFITGQECAYCQGKIISHDQVEEMFAKEGYHLLEKYKNSPTKMRVMCPEGHERLLSCAKFKQGRRCAQCAKYGYDCAKPARLYYLRFDLPGHQTFYKIGVTNNTVFSRVGASDMKYCKILLDKTYEAGAKAKEEELKIIKRFDSFRYKGAPVLKRGGNTELFIRDVLMLDSVLIYA